MTNITAHIKRLLASSNIVLGTILFISLFSLASALTAEVAFGLEPCIMCIYQRIPFVITAALSLTALLWKPFTQAAIALSGYAFFVNSGIAFYHTGIERKWWTSAVEGCAVPSFSEDPQSILENILSAPTARCDEIPWADPILGLSMANYNVLLCFGMFVICTTSVTLIKQHQTQT